MYESYGALGVLIVVIGAPVSFMLGGVFKAKDVAQHSLQIHLIYH